VGGRKSPSPIDLAHGLYNSLYYRTSRDSLGNYFQNPSNKPCAHFEKYLKWPSNEIKILSSN